MGSVLGVNGNCGVCPKLSPEGTPVYPSGVKGDGEGSSRLSEVEQHGVTGKERCAGVSLSRRWL